MKTADIMTQDVISVTPNDTLVEAMRVMAKNDISGVPVITSEGRLVGMLTEGDLLRRAELGTEKHRAKWLGLITSPDTIAAEYVQTHARKVEDVMTRHVEVVTEDTELSEVVNKMEGKHIKRLPVVRGSIVVGIISRANLLHALAAHQTAAIHSPGDVEIRKRLITEINSHLKGIGRYNVVVTDGVVDLWGTVFINPDTLRVAAETIPGVREVRSHVTWIEPQSGLVVNPYDNDIAAQRDRATVVN